MTNINFLPTRYREKSAKQRIRIWQISILLVFGGVIVTTAIVQQSFRRSAAQQLKDVEVPHAAALAIKAQHDQLQADLKQARAESELYAYLRHLWPRTQVLLELSKSLPNTIVLTQVSISRQLDRSRERDQRANRDLRRAEGQNGQPQSPGSAAAARQDLQQIRELVDDLPVIVVVSGVTSDALALHHYLAELKAARLFAKAKLVSFESLAGKQSESSRFALQLTLRAGYGQANGPTAVAICGDAQRVAVAEESR